MQVKCLAFYWRNVQIILTNLELTTKQASHLIVNMQILNLGDNGNNTLMTFPTYLSCIIIVVIFCFLDSTADFISSRPKWKTFYWMETFVQLAVLWAADIFIENKHNNLWLIYSLWWTFKIKTLTMPCDCCNLFPGLHATGMKERHFILEKHYPVVRFPWD